MKAHVAWIRHVAAAAMVAGVGSAEAQYAPYRPSQQPVSPPAATSPYGAMWQQSSAPAATPVQPAAPIQAAAAMPAPVQSPQTQAATAGAMPQAPAAASPYPQTSAPYVPSAYPTAAQQSAIPQGYPQSGYPQVGYPQVATQYPATYPAYPVVARQPNGDVPPPTPPAPNGAPQNGTNGAPTNGANGQAANGHQNGHNGHANGQHHHANGHNGDAHAHANGTYANTADGGCNKSYPDQDLSGYFDNPCYESVWFGGVYYLFMQRDRPTDVKLAVEVDHAVAPDPYYPPASQTRLVSPDHDYRSGAEIRFGSTFSVSDSCDSGCGTGAGYGCNCAPCNYDVYAWEFGAWAIDEDLNIATFIDMPTTRMYGMKNFVGLEYDRDGAGAGYIYRPANDYYGYGLPIPAPPGAPADGYVAVHAQRVRTNFDCQNFEVNVMRFPVCDMACGGGGCNSGCGASGCGTTGCSGDNGACGCEPECCPSVFSAYGSCGVRYFRADDSFMYASEFGEIAGGAYDQVAYDGFTYDNSNELIYNVNVENQLIGPQLGWTMNYNYACKWNFFMNSTFGVFNNHMTAYQRMWSGGGGAVRFAGDGTAMNVSSSKDDIAFLGELRLGGAYDITCNWRAVLAYRAVALTGTASSTTQIADDFTNRYEVAHIDSNNSMVVHGVQAGAECRY